MRDVLDGLREKLRSATLVDPSTPVSSVTGEYPLFLAARGQLEEREKRIGKAPEWAALSTIKGGAAGVSLLLDVIGLSAESGIKRLGLAGTDLDHRAHALVDLWSRAEAARSLLVELFELWPGGAPEERIAALRDGVVAVSSECVARSFDGAFDNRLNPVQLVDFVREMGIGGWT